MSGKGAALSVSGKKAIGERDWIEAVTAVVERWSCIDKRLGAARGLKALRMTLS